MELVRRAYLQKPNAKGVRRTRWVVVRNTYRELIDTTIKTFFDWVPQSAGTFVKQDMVFMLNTALPDSTTVEAEFLFRALDRPSDVRKLLSLELTGGFVNECREVPKQVVDMLQSRVGRFPTKRDGGPTWSGIILDTNPPDSDSWYYKLFEEERPEGFALYHQPSGLSPNAENVEHLPAGYYDKMMGGKTQEWINVYVHGLYGMVVEGKPVFPEYNDALHYSPSPLSLQQTLPLYVGIDFGLCYDDQTEVLTLDGFKLFKDVDILTDQVATINPVTRAFEYTSVNFKTDYAYKGEMLCWESNNVNLCVTPEHRVPYVRRVEAEDDTVRFASAEELAQQMGQHNRVMLVSDYDAVEFNPLPDVFEDAGQYAAFMGWWCSDGSVYDNRVSITQTKARNLSVIQGCLPEGLKWRYGKSAFRASSSVLAEYLRELGSKQECRIPDDVRFNSRRVIDLFMKAYIAGDGHVRTRANGSVETCVFAPSRACAGVLQELAQKIGLTSSLYEQKPKASYLKAEDRWIVGTKPGWRVTLKRKQYAGLNKRHFSRVQYDGRIYCLNVPHHTLYVRRKGVPSWNGNTPAAVFGQVTPTGAIVVVDELVTFDMGAVNFAKLLRERLQTDYAKVEDVRIYGDPAGEQRAQTDERTPFMILAKEGLPATPAPTNDFTIRREVVAERLTKLTVTGKPALIIGPKCPILRKGLAGGYHYKRLQVAGERFVDKPDKGRYSHICDALQYMCLGAVGMTRVIGSHNDEIDYSEIDKYIV
jgi:hypothetical protein